MHHSCFQLQISHSKYLTLGGLICSLITENKEYRFATYNNSKIIKYEISNNSLDITLQKGIYTLDVKSKYDRRLKLSAPIKGEMIKDILESINEEITITLKKDDITIFSDTSINCGLEIVK